MEQVDLGESGLRVSRVGLGCNNFGSRVDAARTRSVVEAALDSGVTFFDTADVYGGEGGSERMLGEILEGRREQVVLATKFGWGPDRGFGGPDRMRESLARSLQRLRTDYVDLFYLHKPDPDTPIADTLSALDEIVRQGVVRAIGCSNVSADQLAEADRVARELGVARFSVVQNEYSLLKRDDDADVLPLCRELRVAYVPYFPLASGLLTGKYRRGEPAPEGTRLAGRELDDERLARVEALARVAADHGHRILDLAISALASTPGIASVIAGATSADQVRANAAAGRWHVPDDLLRTLADVRGSRAVK